MTPDQEILEIVNERDEVIGTAARSEIHRRGLLHRAVHIFVFDPEGNIYVQRRAASKDRHPGKLDSSAAGHVDPGESYLQTASRELQEELGIKEQLQEILKVAACPETDNEHVVLFVTTTSGNPVPAPDEIQWGEFISIPDLLVMIHENPHDFVPAFILLWNEYKKSPSC